MKILPARNVICAAVMAGTLGFGATTLAQTADANVDRYTSLLTQIENVRLGIEGRKAKVETQKARITELQQQVKLVPALRTEIRPIIATMVAEIEKEIVKDIPFKAAERYARLDSVKEKLENPEIGESELYRLAMNMYDIEANYGNSIGAYTGNNPVNPGRRLAACVADQKSAGCALTEDQALALASGATLDDRQIKDSLTDGNFVHFGRMSLVYLELDSSEGYRWDIDSKEWVALSGNDIIGTRRAVRVARGESAPVVVTGPIRMTAAK